MASTAETRPGDGAGRGERRGVAMQVMASVAFSFANFTLAGSFSFGGVLADQLTASDSDLTLSTGQVSWTVSVLNAGSMLGYVISSYAAPRVGTTRIVQLCAPAVAASWILLALSGNFWTLLAGRFLVGTFSGVTIGPTIAYMGEVASPRLRGYLTTLPIVNGCVGILSAFLFGRLLGWRRACFVMGCGPMAVQFVVALVLPRSAKWLISKGFSEEEAKRSLRFFHGDGYDVDGQISAIRESLGEGHKHDATPLQVLALLRHRHNVVPFLLVLALYAFFVFSGGSTTSTFAPVMLRDFGAFDDPYLGAIAAGAVRVASTVVALVIMDRVERKTLLMVNGVGGAAASLVAGLAFVFKAQLTDHGWVLLAAILVIVCLMSTGICSVVFVMFAELLPNAIRAEVSGVCLLFFGAANFVMMYSFPLAVASVGMAGVFWFFTGMHVLMFVFAKLCLPSTGGKSLEEIQKMFVKDTVQDAAAPVHIHTELSQETECTKL